MSILCTVTTNLQSKNAKGYAGIQRHTEHDPNINHSNKDINFDETRFNVYNEGLKARKAVADWNNDKFSDFVCEHDEHQRSTGHKGRCYNNVQGYLKDRKKATGVLTIGNMEVQTQLIKRFCPSSSYDEEILADGTKHAKFRLKAENGEPITENVKIATQFYGCFTRALNTATNNSVGWHLKNGGRVNVSDYLFRGRWAVNNDEMGMSHIHFELATYGMTRGGKSRKSHATSSLNQALVSLHKAVKGTNCSGREALKWYRSEIDKYALKCLENELHRTYNVPEHDKILVFERKTSEDPSTMTGLSMTQLKQQKQEIAHHQQQVQQLQQQASELDSQNKDAQKRIDTAQQISNVAQNVKNDVNKTYTALTGQQIDNNTSPLDVARAVKSVSDDVKQEVNDNKQRIQRQKQRISQQQQQIEEQQRQLHDMRQQRDALKKENKQLTEDNNALKATLEVFKRRLKSAGLIIGQWVRNHWDQLEKPFRDYAHNISNAENERIRGGRDKHGDYYQAQRYEKEAKSGLFSAFDAIEMKTAKDLGIQQAFKPSNTQQANKDDELSK